MKPTLERLPKSRVRFLIKVPQERVQKAVNEAYKSLNAQVEIKGFRKGQAPKSMIFESVGLARLRETILQRLLPDTYFEVLQSERLVPVEGPQVNIESADWEKELLQGRASTGISYKVEVDILPKVELISDYKKIRVKNPPTVDISDEEVENVINHLRRQHAEFKEVTRPADNGDRIEIEFEGKIDKIAQPDFSSKNFPLLLGQGTLQSEFEKHLFGMKRGDKKSFTLAMPRKDDPKGKQGVQFTVVMLDVKEVILPALTEELAKKLGQDSVLALRGAVRQSLRTNKEDRQRRDLEQRVADELLQRAKLEIPASLVHQEIHRMIDSLKSQATSHGMPWEQYLMQIKKTEEQLHQDLHDQAEKTVKFGLVLGTIINREGMDTKDKDVGRKVMEKLVQYATG